VGEEWEKSVGREVCVGKEGWKELGSGDGRESGKRWRAYLGRTDVMKTKCGEKADYSF
jgi:hypothetical protein